MKIDGATSIVQVRVDGARVYATTTANLGTGPVKTIQLGSHTAAQRFAMTGDDGSVARPPDGLA